MKEGWILLQPKPHPTAPIWEDQEGDKNYREFCFVGLLCFVEFDCFVIFCYWCGFENE
jgi:hypothetical protein